MLNIDYKIVKEFTEALSGTEIKDLSDNDISSLVKLSNTLPAVLNELDITLINLNSVLRRGGNEQMLKDYNELKDIRNTYVSSYKKIEEVLNVIFTDRGKVYE